MLALVFGSSPVQTRFWHLVHSREEPTVRVRFLATDKPINQLQVETLDGLKTEKEDHLKRQVFLTQRLLLHRSLFIPHRDKRSSTKGFEGGGGSNLEIFTAK